MLSINPNIKLAKLARLLGIALILCLVGCRGDGASSIVNGYQIVFISKDDVLIDNAGSDSKHRVTLQARVDAYRVEGDTILVARTPQEVYLNEHGNSDYRMLSICEYWIIDTKKDTLKKTSKINGMSCH